MALFGGFDEGEAFGSRTIVPADGPKPQRRAA